MQEKRRHRRIRAKGIAAYLQVEDMSASAIIENISAGGIFIRTARPLSAGTPIALSLVRPGLKKAVQLTGTVASQVEQRTAEEIGGPPGMGIAFDPIEGDAAKRLERILKDLGLPAPFALEVPGEPDEIKAPFLPPRSSYAGEPETPRQQQARLDAQVQAQVDAAAKSQVAGGGGRALLPGDPDMPEIVRFQLEVPKPAQPSSAEMERLMRHIRGLLAQLADVEEKMTIRNRQLVLANDEIERLRVELEEKNKQIHVLLGAKTR